VPYNLTEGQKSLARWMVQENRVGNLSDEFSVTWLSGGGFITTYNGDQPELSRGSLDALAASELIISESRYRTTTSMRGTSKRPKLEEKKTESSRQCTLTAKAYEAVDSDFDAPDTSFVKQLTPLADVTNLDDELKRRCLPILGAGSVDPMMWDSAVRTAGVILEERLRDVGGIKDMNRTGRQLVNDVFGDSGSLAGKFVVPSERMGYRDLYSGIVGAFRNPSAHRVVDPTPEEGGAFIVFVNLLLKRLEDLR
jgi:hypothetical protein